MALRADILTQLHQENTVQETRLNGTRRLLLRQRASGIEHGRHGRIYVLTEAGHAAHPALMTVQLVERVGGGPGVERTGISGGDPAALDAWLASSRADDEADAQAILDTLTPTPTTR